MKVLVIAPHPDDEVIGVGGTIAKRAKDGHDVYVCVVTKAFPPLFSDDIVEQARKECREADKFLGVIETSFLDFPAVTLETIPRYELNGGIQKIIQRVKPDEVYLPHRGDMQLDHKMIVDAAMVALRPKYAHRISRIYAYETLSETGWDIPNTVNEFIPTVYEDITDTLEKKLQAMNIFQSQLADFPAARSLGAIEALAKFRGATVNVMAAEAFSLIREIKV
ncbi:N-acetylglucosaminyl deacetylase, LmbE family [Lachnospiraceae bacterium NE2001]|nr:N-acetylglucosaminyl deacetylase, LmbE family [Lachnospiraceae bacterium NE2001]